MIKDELKAQIESTMKHSRGEKNLKRKWKTEHESRISTHSLLSSMNSHQFEHKLNLKPESLFDPNWIKVHYIIFMGWRK